MSARSFPELEVLVVDDEEFSRSIVVRILRKLNVKRIRTAANGYEGLEHVRYPNHVDVVILDFHMPRMNGLEMLKKVRDGSAGVDRDLSIAMLTGHGDTRLVSTAMALDVNAFLVKPTSLEVIANRLDRILNEPRDIKDAAVYGEIQLPTTIWLSSERARQPNPVVSFHGTSAPVRTVKLQLENVPANAVVSEDVMGPDGMLLLPAGTKLSARLLSYLQDLKALDDCVSQLVVEFPETD